jgi:hypothetical protein
MPVVWVSGAGIQKRVVFNGHVFPDVAGRKIKEYVWSDFHLKLA